MAKLASCLPFTMMTLHSFFVLASLTSLAAAAAAADRALPHSFSFQLHLRHPPSELISLPTLSSSSMPLIPKLFSDLPLSALNSRHAYNSTVGSASGLYLYDAASAELRFFYFTATLDLIPNGAQSGIISSRCSAGGASCSGSLVLMGNVDSGAISVVGGTRDFAFCSGQANVTIGLSPSSSSSSSSDPVQLISFDVELQYEGVHNSIAPLL